MARIRIALGCYLIALTSLLFASTKVAAQTPEAKPKPTGSISGRVTVGDKPLPGVLVVASTLGANAPSAQATSDAEGNYRLSGLGVGQITVMPAAPLYVIPASPMFGPGRAVNLAANEAVENIDFKLTRGGVITGRITDADGRPVIEERISTVQVDDNGAPVRGPTVRSANYMMYSTDDRGIYRIYGLPPGHYKISAGDDAGRTAGFNRAAGYYPRVFYPDVTDMAKATTIDVTAGGETKNIDIKLGRRTPTFSASGRILDADTNQPLAGVYFSFGAVQQNQNQSYVTSTSSSGNPTTSTGEFRTEGLSPGRYALMINTQDFGRMNATGPKVYCDPVVFEIVDGDVTNLEVKANRGLSISGVIVPDGITDKNILARLSKLVVSAFISPRPQALQTFSNSASSPINPDGGFTIEGLRPGRVNLNVGSNRADALGFTLTKIELDGAIHSQVIDLPAGQNLSGLRLHVTYGTGVIRGTVKTEGGELPADAMFFVNASRAGEGSRFGDQVDSRGRFTVRGVPAGTYEIVLQIVSMGGQTATVRNFPRQLKQTVTVADGAETEVVFTIDLTKKEGP